jgi:metallo-beta-lactamase family protein
MLMDSAKIQVKDSEYFNKKRQKRHEEEIDPLYTPEDVEPVLALFKMVNYENWHAIDKEISFLFRDAGHILGSASVTLKIHTKHEGDILLGFTGDVGRPKRPILKDPIPMPECDYLITESTYGGRRHEASPEDVNHLLDVIYETCIRNGGKVIIPAFSVGRTQEIVYMLNNLWNEKRLPKIPVYVDSPLSVNVTGIYAKHPECYDQEIREIMKRDPNPFGFQCLEFITDTQDSKELNTSKEPCIIISASGMAESGRIVHHIKHQIENASSTILIVGYASEHSLAGRLRKKPDFVKIFGQEHRVNARIEIMDSFSAHGDEEELVQFLSNQNRKRLKNIFLVHGEEEGLQAFSTRLQKEGFSQTTIPAYSDIITIE